MTKPNVTSVNQLHPPKKKNKNEVNLNVLRKIYYKDGNSTMLVAKDVPIGATKVFVASVKDTANKLGIKIQGHFLITL